MRTLLLAFMGAVAAVALVSAGCRVLANSEAAHTPLAPISTVLAADAVTLGDTALALFAVDDMLRGPAADRAIDAAEAVAWMTDLGLMKGMQTETTSPDVRVTRGDLAVILHRFAGSPSVRTAAFPDVTHTAEVKAVAWMRNAGLTTGTSPTTYSPSRQALVAELDAFLERLDESMIVRMPYGVAHTVVDEHAIADPFIVPVDDGYILYATQEAYVSLPVWTSDDLRTWEFVGDALEELPAWVEWGRTWAPDVFFHNGRWEMLFTARAALQPIMCIGRAVAESPLGPFIGDEEPLVCQQKRGGAIDPRRFVDRDGRTYLHWKSDDNHLGVGAETVLWSQELDDELQFTGPRVRLMGSDDAAHLGPIVESPQMVLVEEGYVLTYSAGDGYRRPAQYIGTATCEGPLGPCVPSADRLIASSDDGPGPGEHSLFVDHRGTLQVAYGPFHAGHLDRPRVLALAAIASGSTGFRVVVPQPSDGGAESTVDVVAPP